MRLAPSPVTVLIIDQYHSLYGTLCGFTVWPIGYKHLGYTSILQWGPLLKNVNVASRPKIEHLTLTLYRSAATDEYYSLDLPNQQREERCRYG